MSQDRERKQLELLQNRLKKAYSLPESEQEKWRNEIEELENQSNILRTQLGIRFDEDKAIGLLIQTNIEMCKELKSNYGAGEFQSFLKNNPRANKIWNRTNEVNVAYKLRDMKYFQKCLLEYKNNILEIDEMYFKGADNNVI